MVTGPGPGSKSLYSFWSCSPPWLLQVDVKFWHVLFMASAMLQSWPRYPCLYILYYLVLFCSLLIPVTRNGIARAVRLAVSVLVFGHGPFGLSVSNLPWLEMFVQDAAMIWPCSAQGLHFSVCCACSSKGFVDSVLSCLSLALKGKILWKSNQIPKLCLDVFPHASSRSRVIMRHKTSTISTSDQSNCSSTACRFSSELVHRCQSRCHQKSALKLM